jgi:acyl carrier protein
MSTMSSVTERLRTVVARTFRLRIEQVEDATAPAAVAAWDSLGQIDLVTALEQEFSVEFGLDEIMLMNSVGEIRSILERRNGAQG